MVACVCVCENNTWPVLSPWVSKLMSQVCLMWLWFPWSFYNLFSDADKTQHKVRSCHSHACANGQHCPGAHLWIHFSNYSNSVYCDAPSLLGTSSDLGKHHDEAKNRRDVVSCTVCETLSFSKGHLIIRDRSVSVILCSVTFWTSRCWSYSATGAKVNFLCY